MSANALYTDLSGYYDLMCADIDYPGQSAAVARLFQVFGNGGRAHLDLACGSGAHIEQFLGYGFSCTGLDIHQSMLALAQARCERGQWLLQDMCSFEVAAPLDLITCFLYSVHYAGTLARLQACLDSVYRALNPGGLFCFNAVDKERINNASFTQHSLQWQGSELTFRSGWHYPGQGEQQSLRLGISRRSTEREESWQDEHPMVALTIEDMRAMLSPLFSVEVFEHDYSRIVPWDGESGNCLFVCVRR